MMEIAEGVLQVIGVLVIVVITGYLLSDLTKELKG